MLIFYRKSDFNCDYCGGAQRDGARVADGGGLGLTVPGSRATRVEHGLTVPRLRATRIEHGLTVPALR
ncbi:MAG: hypothetical protein KDI09_10410, partial [Halioglobus sp.]|nr:hypothetical protein [Halioglobus sp.]